MPDTMQIQGLLRGYTVDRNNIQSVGNMTVIPIVTDNEFTNVANVNEVSLHKDPEYDKLQFKNASGEIGIAMHGWTIMDKQPAQDRTIPYAHLIKGANSKTIPANCIQSTQGGHFNVAKWNQDDFMILPPSLRGVAIKKATYTNSETGALWNTLGRWVKGVDCEHNGLQNFYSKFEDKLEQFVAQFEPVEKQVGAVVLINGEIIAIDIVPKYESWKRTWRAFIRDSYGAEAVRVKENSGAQIDFGKSFIPSKKIKKLEDLENCFDTMKNDFYDSLQAKVGHLVQQSITTRKLEEIDELTMLKLEGGDMVGQGVLHGDNHFVYVSLVSTKASPKKIEKLKSLRRDPYSDSDFTFRN